MHGDFQKIDSGLLSDRIRDALTDAIASGTIAAGTALDEQNLAARLSQQAGCDRAARAGADHRNLASELLPRV